MVLDVVFVDGMWHRYWIVVGLLITTFNQGVNELLDTVLQGFVDGTFALELFSDESADGDLHTKDASEMRINSLSSFEQLREITQGPPSPSHPP